MLAHVIRQALEQWQAQAGTLLELTVRQIRRIMTRVRHEGDRRLVNRGRLQSSNWRMPARVKSKSSTSTNIMAIFGWPWRQKSWPSGIGSRSVRRRDGGDCVRKGSRISDDAIAPIGHGGSGGLMGELIQRGMARTMAASSAWPPMRADGLH